MSIALCKLGVPVLGVVYNPINQELFTAIKGNGAYFNSRLIESKASPFETMERKMVSTEYGVTRDHISLQSKTNTITRFLNERVRGVRALGSSALASCYVAKHSLDVFWEAGIHLWDICAASVIVGETGGCCVNFDNNKDKDETSLMTLDLFCRKFLVVRSVEGDLEKTVEMIRDLIEPIEVEADYLFNE